MYYKRLLSSIIKINAWYHRSLIEFELVFLNIFMDILRSYSTFIDEMAPNMYTTFSLSIQV